MNMTHVSFWTLPQDDDYGFTAFVIYTCDPWNKQKDLPPSACIMVIP
jgi:hypothetical protein